MQRGIYFLSDEEVAYQLSLESKVERPTLIEVHISDIHFGALDAEWQYNTLKNEFINKIVDLQFDVISINGDLFDHKFMSNSDVIMYATMFIRDLIDLCKMKDAVLVLLHGTLLHDANQLKIFYQYLQDPTIDMRIVEQVQFEYIKGAKILCIPELYGLPREYYEEFLYNSGFYDGVFMHGALRGSIYGTQDSEKHSDKAPIFDIEDFRLCKGPIISGHVHNPGCFKKDFYYCGSPYTWKHGESQNKGFYMVLHNLETHEYYVHFENIFGLVFTTIELDYMLNEDPRDTIYYIDKVFSEGLVDNLRIDFGNRELSDKESSNLEIIISYYRNNSNINILKRNKKKEVIQTANKEMLEKYKDFAFVNDKGLSEFEKLSRYINIKKGYEYTSAEEIKKFYEEVI